MSRDPDRDVDQEASDAERQAEEAERIAERAEREAEHAEGEASAFSRGSDGEELLEAAREKLEAARAAYLAAREAHREERQRERERDRELRRAERAADRGRRHEQRNERRASHFSIDLGALGDLAGEEFTEEIEGVFDVNGPPTIRTRNVSGETRVLVGPDGTVRVQARKRVRGSSDHKAKRLLQNVEVRMEQQGNVIAVRPHLYEQDR